MKTIDTKSYLEALCELTEQGKGVCTVVTGGSMVPFLSSNRDFVYLEKTTKKLRKGNIVLFKRRSGDYVLHRIRYIKNGEFYLIGDRQTVTEGPVKREQITAVATSAKRNGKWICEKNITWKFFEKIWVNIVCLRPAIFKIAGFFKGNSKSGHN